jgi:RNA polymerase primary sigma factor
VTKTLEAPTTGGQTRTRSTRSRSAPSRITSKARRAGLRARILRVLDREIDFIANASFSDPTAEADLLHDEPAPVETDGEFARYPKGLPPHLARLCEVRLLSAEEERHLFRKMNYLKFRANALRSVLDPETSSAAQVEQVERRLAEANQVRERILRANMRLVISVVKKFVVPQFSFDELLSDGIATLMQTVDKFDYDRGFRFSTYAYRAIARNAFRQVNQRQRELNRTSSLSAEAGFDVEDALPNSRLTVKTWTRLRDTLGGMLEQLDCREQFILQNRFALGDSDGTRTFQSLADEMGVSKERVRQLEQRAILKLQRLAGDAQLNQFADCLD